MISGGGEAAGPRFLAIVCESPKDRETATALADRVVCLETGLPREALAEQRRWGGLGQGSDYFDWHDIGEERKRRNLKAYGKFQGEPGAPDAHMARYALQLFNGLQDRPAAVVIVRDDDRDSRRRKGLEQARRDGDWPFQVVLGLAHPERECWVLAGFEPRHAGEVRRLKQIQQELDFDPRREPERLNHPQPGQPRHRKTVLRRLVDADPDRECACWQDCSLQLLEERGLKNGLAEFFAEIRERLVPIFS